MPLTLRYDPEKSIVYGTGDGHITEGEFERCLESIVTSQEYPPSVCTLWDIRSVEFADVDGRYLDNLLRIRARYPARENARIAIVAPRDLSFGMARMYAAKSGDMAQRIRVFRELSDAERWLLSNDADER